MTTEKELKKVRDESAQRRVELSPYKKAFEGLDDEAKNWLLDTVTMIRTSPMEAGERFATLAYGNLGAEKFASWYAGAIGASTEQIKEATQMTDESAPEQSFEEQVLAKIEALNKRLDDEKASAVQEKQFTQITTKISDLGYDPESWQGKMLVQVATNEVPADGTIESRLQAADQIVRERIGTVSSEENQTPSEPEVPLEVPATGGQVGGGGIPNINGDEPVSFNDADMALRQLLNSNIGE